MAKHSIFGCESDGNQQFKDNFHVSDTASTIVAFSKESFHCQLDDKDIEFHIAIEIMDAQAYCDEKFVSYSLYLVPTFKSLSKERQKSVADMCGYTLEDYPAENPINCLEDVFSYGMTCLFAYEQEPYETACNEVSDYEQVKSAMDAIANVYTEFGSLCGFYLDKPQNRIGETGWDYLKEWCE